ncbi:MAG: hypothetical protein AAF871_12485 [Pseudomonadota bacterium]
MEHRELSSHNLAEAITAMTDTEVTQYIRDERKTGRLSWAVRLLNTDVLSPDDLRSERAMEAIRRLGFI